MIVGIDPGTTVGWAVLNLQGERVASGSKREYDLDSLVQKIVSFGSILIVGCDKAKVPTFVQDAATKVGAKVIGPQYDTKVVEKRALTKDFDIENSHEMDALASALFAHKKMIPLLRRIHSALERKNLLSVFEKVADLVIKESISIHAAILIASPQIVVPEEELHEEEKRDEDIVKLYSLLSRSRKDNAILLKKNHAIQNQVKALDRKIVSLNQKTAGLVKPKTPADIRRLKQAQIQSLSHRLQNSAEDQVKLKQKVKSLEHSLLRSDTLAVPRFSHLGWDEVSKHGKYVQDIVFVDNANQMSQKAINWLHDRGVRLLICAQLPGTNARSQLPFACVKAEQVELLDAVALVNKSWLKNARAKREVLVKIVEEYQKDRATSLHE